MTDHAAAIAELLERVVKLLQAGEPPEDYGRAVELLGIIMQRRT